MRGCRLLVCPAILYIFATPLLGQSAESALPFPPPQVIVEHNAPTELGVPPPTPTPSNATAATPKSDTATSDAAKRNAPPPEPGRSGAPPFSGAGWDDGFYFRSADKRFSLRITGQLQADYRAYLDPNDRTDIDGFLVRRARFGLEATLFQYYEFRFMPEFGQGQTRLIDAFMTVHYWDAVQLTAGKFKQPFSYEQLIQDRFTPLMERSLIDQLVPARDVGVMLHGVDVFNGMLDYGVAVSNGQRDGDTDTNDSKDVNGRVAVRPFAGWTESPLRRLQIGIAAGIGLEAEPVSPQVLRTPAGIPFFQFRTGVAAAGVRARWSPEIAYFVGGFGFAAQYFQMTQRLRSPTDGTVAVPFEGFYAQATYLLTGEDRHGFSQWIAPRRPFDPRCGSFGPGAWELVARVSRLRLGEDVYAPGAARLADPMATSNAATELTTGFNWYLNRWARFQFNAECAWFDRPVRLGPGLTGRISAETTLQTRVQFIF